MLPAGQCQNDQTDAGLLRRLRRGDDAAFGSLVDRHGGRLFGLAVSMLGNPADAEDVVQETFTGAFRGLGGFLGKASVKTWLTRILVNKVAKHRRSQRVRRAISLEQTLPSEPPGRDEAVNGTDIRMDVSAVLARLSEPHRDVIVLRELQGMSYQEMARVLAVPRGTVESRLYRARQQLKELLKDYLP